jgi:hypothetical protein
MQNADPDKKSVISKHLQLPKVTPPQPQILNHQFRNFKLSKNFYLNSMQYSSDSRIEHQLVHQLQMSKVTNSTSQDMGQYHSFRSNKMQENTTIPQ